MTALFLTQQPEAAPSPRVIHVSIEALDSLRGILRIDSLPFIHQQYGTLYCGSQVWPGPTEWISPRSVSLWRRGELLVLPNCPSCSVAWDEAMEAYMARGST
jgi:hypothetical protein